MRMLAPFIVFLFGCLLLAFQPGNSVNKPKEELESLPDTIGIQLTGAIEDTTAARKYLERAKEFQEAGKHEDALLQHKKALDIYLSTLGEKDSLTISAYLKVSSAFIGFNKPDSASIYIAKTMNLSERVLGDINSIKADCFHLLGLINQNQGKYQNAVKYYEEALRIRKKVSGYDSLELAKTHNNLGNVWVALLEYEKAEENLLKALNIKKKIYGENNPGIADSYNNLGILFRRNGDYDQALEYYEKSMVVYEAVKMHLKVALIHQNIGALLTLKGDYGKAMESLEESLRIRKEHLSDDDLNIGSSYNILGWANSYAGNYEKAYSYFQKALGIFLRVTGEDHPSVSTLYHNISALLYESEDFEKALFYADKSFNINMKKYGPTHISLHKNYDLLGGLYGKMGDYEKAISYQKIALELIEPRLGKDHPQVAEVYNNIGVNLKNMGKYEEALEYYNVTLKTRLEKLPKHHPDIAGIYLNIGNVLLKKGDTEEALQALKKALIALKYDKYDKNKFLKVVNLNKLQGVLFAFENYYKLEYADGEKKTYLDSLNLHYATLIDLEKYMYRQHNNDFTRQFYFLRSLPVYESAIEAILEEDKFTSVENSFSLSEITKARSLYESLNSTFHKNSFGLPDSLREKEHNLNIDISYYEKKKYQEEYESATPNDSLVAVYEDKVFNLKRERDDLIELFKTGYPDYFNLRYSQQVISVKGVQDSLLQKDQTLVEYFVGDSSIFTFVVSKDTFLVHQIDKDFPLGEWVQKMREGIYLPFSSSSPGRETLDSLHRVYAENAYKLYEKLILPVKSSLPEQGQLIIVPDGVLGYLPFDALLTRPVDNKENPRDYPYLIHDYQTSIAYSATLLKQMQERKHGTSPSRNFLGVAPTFDADDFDTAFYASRFIDYSNERNRLGALVENIPEVRSLQVMIGGDILIDTLATKENFLRRAGDYRILHLSTHGKANDKVGDYSFLAFYELEDSLENEWLYNRELYELDLNADMVVLSACETGIGELQRGEGIISLARGFSYAGAKSIITSLWNVNDRQTPVIMRSFYGYLKEGYSKDAALRQAKLDYLQTSANPEPFFWATFIPIGDMQPIAFRSGLSWWKWAFLGAGVLLAFGVYVRKRRLSTIS